MTDAVLQGLLSLAWRPHVVIAFNKILIANRGEIACRIIRTAKALGYRTVAVFSDADAGARHVRLAHEAVRIGPPPAAESYLKIDALIAAAKLAGADAVHPGYGFLSENAAFAQASADAGLIFIGPPPAAIDAMGNKARAKVLMEAAGVPCVPGYQGPDQSDAEWRLFVVATIRGKLIRVISARDMSKREEKEYDNAQGEENGAQGAEV